MLHWVPLSRRCRWGATAAMVAVGMLATGAGIRPASTGELRLGLPRVPPSLDPWLGVMPSELMVLRLCFEGLVTVGERGGIEPGLASQWTVSRDGLLWTFRLREGLQLWSGMPLHADAVVASLAGRISPDEPVESAPPWTRLFSGGSRVVREVRRGDAGTVEIQLSQPYAPLLAVLAHPALAIAVPPEGGEPGLLGTGPYRPVQQGPGGLVLEAVPGGRPPPRSDRLVLEEVADEAAALAELGPGGRLDVLVASSPPPPSAAGVRVLAGPSWQIGLLAFRTDQGFFRQKVARQAAAFAVDPGLIQPVLGRWAAPLSAYLPPGAWAARDVPRSFDLARARRLLTQLGGASPGVTLLAPEAATGPDPTRLADALRAALVPAGIKARVRSEPVEIATAAMRRGEADLALLEVSLAIDDPQFLLRPLLWSEAATSPSGTLRGPSSGTPSGTPRGTPTGTPNGTNVAFFRSPLVDGMLSRAGQLGFRPERLRLYERLQTLVAEELPYLPLYVRLQWLVTRADVQGASLEASGLHRLERMWRDVPLAPPAASAPAVPPVPMPAGPPLPAPPVLPVPAPAPPPAVP